MRRTWIVMGHGVDMVKIRERVESGADINEIFFHGGKPADTLSIITSRSRYQERLENIRECIEMGSRLDPVRHAYPWLLIVEGGDTKEVGGLLDRYPDMLNTRFFGAGQDGLCAALINNDARMVQFLLSRGANPNQYTGWYSSTLHRAEHAIQQRFPEIECAILILHSEYAILLMKAARFGADESSGPCDTPHAWVSRLCMTSLPSDLQMELASYFW